MAKSHFPEFEDDVEFVKQLIVEQGIVTFPGSVSGECSFFINVIVSAARFSYTPGPCVLHSSCLMINWWKPATESLNFVKITINTNDIAIR